MKPKEITHNVSEFVKVNIGSFFLVGIGLLGIGEAIAHPEYTFMGSVATVIGFIGALTIHKS